MVQGELCRHFSAVIHRIRMDKRRALSLSSRHSADCERRAKEGHFHEENIIDSCYRRDLARPRRVQQEGG